jgi:N-methylhydantoinase A
MGGTSFDVGMIVDGLPVITPSQEIARFHIIKPAVDVKAIGAGGGSIARVERGELRLGPQSAGAVPGPACYGHGGTNPTVTDADVVLGIIDPDFFLGGRLSLDETAARNAVESKIAEPLGISVDEAAMGIKKVADHQMADLLTTLTIGQGLDPREFTIFAYGGAGPTHCHAYGAHLGVEAVVVPSTAMVHSAYGAVASDLFRSAEVSDIMHTTPFAGGGAGLDAAAIGRIFEGLETQTGDSLKRSGIKRADISYTRFVDMRFRFQVNELIVPASSGPIDSAALDGLVTAFETIYEERYGEGSAFREGGVELVTFRIQARGQLPNPGLRKLGSNGKQPVASAGTREVRLPDFGAVEAAVYRGELLSPGAHIDGPAVIEHPGTTIVVGPGQRAEIDEWLNTIIKF